MGVTEDQIAAQLAELEPTWVSRPNRFAALIAQGDTATLRRHLDDPLPAARADAAYALGQLKDKSAADRLKQLTGDLDPLVRRSAAAALVALADEGMLKEFVKSLRDPIRAGRRRRRRCPRGSGLHRRGPVPAQGLPHRAPAHRRRRRRRARAPGLQ